MFIGKCQFYVDFSVYDLLSIDGKTFCLQQAEKGLYLKNSKKFRFVLITVQIFFDLK